jgi:hypothetical protein
VRADLRGHSPQHVSGDVLVPLCESSVGPAHDLHRGPVGYAEFQTGREQCSNRANASRWSGGKSTRTAGAVTR